MIFLPFFVMFLTAHGFLLDKTPISSGQSGISNQYVTASELVDETMARHQENEQLRQFITKALSVLTSQLQQKFESLEQKLIKCENQSSPNQDPLEQKFNDLEHKYTELERKYTALQPVNIEFNLMKSQLVSVQNKTSQISNDVLILKQLGSIKPLQEIQSLQTAVQTVSALTHSLSVNERARSQDFLALYNMTIDSKRALSELTWNTSNHFKNSQTKTSNQLSNLEHRQNTTEADIGNQLKKLEANTNKQLSRIEQSQNSTVADIIARMEAKETSDNLTMTMVQKQINNNAERVAMTAHPSHSSGTITNTILKFDDVKFSEGVTNLAAYKSTGKFTCEHEGLYIISASVMSYTNNAKYYISLNGNYISETYISQNSNTEVHTGAVTVTRKLNLNDKVWLYAAGSWYFYGDLWSTFTMIKIK